MKITGIKLILLLCVSIFFSSMTGYVSGVRAGQQRVVPEGKAASRPEPLQISSIQTTDALQSNQPVPLSTTQTFVVRDYEGSIALFTRFSNGSEELRQEYDIYVNTLPSSDRNQLAEGIEFDTLSDALRLIEDYSG